MTWDCRRPSLIQEELSDLNDLITEKQNLIEKYPEKFSLKMGLENLKNREKCLLLELKTSYERYQIDTFDFIFDGDVVNKYRISLPFIGSFAYALQDFVTSISQSVSNQSASKRVISKEMWDKSQLDLVATTTGSFRIVVASHEYQLGESIQKQSLRCLNTLTDCEDNKEKIKEISKSIGLKSMKKYQKIMEIIYKNNATVKMYDTIVPEGFHTKEINSELAKKIYNAINDADKKPAEKVTYFGKLTGVNVRSYKFEFVIVDSQEIINGYFGKSLAEETKKRLDTTTNIQFELTTVYDEVLDEEKKKWSIVTFID